MKNRSQQSSKVSGDLNDLLTEIVKTKLRKVSFCKDSMNNCEISSHNSRIYAIHKLIFRSIKFTSVD